MNITILASIGSQNLGDELILKNEIKILKIKYSKLKNISENEIFFNVFTYDLKDNFYISENVKYIEYFPINIKKFKYIFRNIFNFFTFIKTVIKSDLIVVGGGGIIYDNELQSVSGPLKQWNFRSNIFKLFNKKVEFFRVGINIKNKNNFKILKNIFSCSSDISVRDYYSFDLLKKIGFLNVELIKDPVFFDNIKEDKEIKYYNYKIKKDFLKGKIYVQNLNVQKIKNIILENNIKIFGKNIGISLRKQEIYNYNSNIIEIINYFIKNKCTIYLIPHSFHKKDNKANDFIFLNQIKNKINSDDIFISHNMKESYKIYTQKKIDLNLSSRLHSIILSQVYEIDFIGISYSTKTDEVIKIL